MGRSFPESEVMLKKKK